MSEYPVITGKTVCIFAQLDPNDTPRYVRAKVYRPDGILIWTVDLTEVRPGYHEHKTLTFDGQDFWKVELVVYSNAARTVRDESYQPLVDYLWEKSTGTSGCTTVGGEIDLVAVGQQEIGMEVENTMSSELFAQEKPDINISVDEDSEVSLQIEQKPIIELQYECKES